MEMTSNSPANFDILTAESVAWHMATMMTTNLHVDEMKIFSPLDVFKYISHQSRTSTRSTASSSQLSVRGRQLTFSENMIKRAFATKYVRTALFSQCPTVEFVKSQAKTDIIVNEFRVGHVCRFRYNYDHTSVSFDNIQNIIFYWYIIDYKLHSLKLEFEGFQQLRATAFAALSSSTNKIVKSHVRSCEIYFTNIEPIKSISIPSSSYVEPLENLVSPLELVNVNATVEPHASSFPDLISLEPISSTPPDDLTSNNTEELSPQIMKSKGRKKKTTDEYVNEIRSLKRQKIQNNLVIEDLEKNLVEAKIVAPTADTFLELIKAGPLKINRNGTEQLSLASGIMLQDMSQELSQEKVYNFINVFTYLFVFFKNKFYLFVVAKNFGICDNTTSRSVTRGSACSDSS